MVSLKVDNLTYRTTAEDLKKLFDRCGDVGDIYIPRDPLTGESRGFAFVRYIKNGTREFRNAVSRADAIRFRRHPEVPGTQYGRAKTFCLPLRKCRYVFVYAVYIGALSARTTNNDVQGRGITVAIAVLGYGYRVCEFRRKIVSTTRWGGGGYTACVFFFC